MNESQANKMIELLEELVQNTRNIESKIDYIDSSLSDIQSNTLDLSELSRIRSAIKDSESILKNIDDKILV
jgi:hypothetical protein